MRHILAAVAAILGLVPCAVGKLTVTGVGGFTLSAPGSSASGLSDLAYDADANVYWAVSDNDNNLYPLTLDLNTTSGAIESGSIGMPLTLLQPNGDPYPGPRDQEGITMIGPGFVYVSYESNAGYSNHHLSHGRAHIHHTLATLYPPSALRPNLAFESITRNTTGFWIANEEAMTTDGPVSGNGAGTTVRLTRISPATSQYLYTTDGDSDGFAVVRSGVSGLLLLDDGSLLVLERAQSDDFIPRFRSSLYLIDPAGATNVVGVGALTGSETTVTKTLLWSHTFPGLTNWSVNNFEGLTLGPTLDTGETSLILAADNDNSLIGTNHNLYALRLALTLPGDANNDGVVDGQDVLAVEQHFGDTGNDNGLLTGDANDDGRVDALDYLAVERHFGSAWPSSSIPEPATLVLFAPAIFLRRRRTLAV